MTNATYAIFFRATVSLLSHKKPCDTAPASFSLRTAPPQRTDAENPPKEETALEQPKDHLTAD
jgi:hypothetical protein